MNGWDLVTWTSAVLLAVAACVIFGFFLRDAGSILDREMHGHDEPSPGSESPASGANPGPPEDVSP